VESGKLIIQSAISLRKYYAENISSLVEGTWIFVPQFCVCDVRVETAAKEL
jgi:hypothetical protein